MMTFLIVSKSGETGCSPVRGQLATATADSREETKLDKAEALQQNGELIVKQPPPKLKKSNLESLNKNIN